MSSLSRPTLTNAFPSESPPTLACVPQHRTHAATHCTAADTLVLLCWAVLCPSSQRIVISSDYGQIILRFDQDAFKAKIQGWLEKAKKALQPSQSAPAAPKPAASAAAVIPTPIGAAAIHSTPPLGEANPWVTGPPAPTPGTGPCGAAGGAGPLTPATSAPGNQRVSAATADAQAALAAADRLLAGVAFGGYDSVPTGVGGPVPGVGAVIGEGAIDLARWLGEATPRVPAPGAPMIGVGRGVVELAPAAIRAAAPCWSPAKVHDAPHAVEGFSASVPPMVLPAGRAADGKQVSKGKLAGPQPSPGEVQAGAEAAQEDSWVHFQHCYSGFQCRDRGCVRVHGELHPDQRECKSNRHPGPWSVPFNASHRARPRRW